jgi:hypothetical protein
MIPKFQKIDNPKFQSWKSFGNGIQKTPPKTCFSGIWKNLV